MDTGVDGEDATVQVAEDETALTDDMDEISFPNVQQCPPRRRLFNFSEADSSENLVMNGDGEVTAATFEKLIERLTHPSLAGML
jgi:hypothetical protein